MTIGRLTLMKACALAVALAGCIGAALLAKTWFDSRSDGLTIEQQPVSPAARIADPEPAPGVEAGGSRTAGRELADVSVALPESTAGASRSVLTVSGILLDHGAAPSPDGVVVEIRVFTPSGVDAVTEASTHGAGEFSARVALPSIAESSESLIAVAEVTSADHGYAIARAVTRKTRGGGWSPLSFGLRLRRSSSVVGAVEDEDGNRVANAVATVFKRAEFDSPDARRMQADAVTRSDGTFTVPMAEPGEYILLVRADNFGVACQAFSVATVPSLVDLTLFRLSGSAVMGATILAANGAPMGQLSILATHEMAGSQNFTMQSANDLRPASWMCSGLIAGTAKTDDNGLFRIGGLAPGAYYLTQLSDPRYGQPASMVPALPGQMATLPIYPFKVRVVDMGGRPVPLASVVVSKATPPLREASESGEVIRASTNERGEAIVPWSGPDQVIIEVKAGVGALGNARFNVPAAGCTEVPVVTVPVDVSLGTASLAVVVPGTLPPSVDRFKVKVANTRAGSTEVVVWVSPPSPAELVGLDEGEYRVTLVQQQGATPTFYASSESLEQVIVLQAGAHEEVRLTPQLGGRLRVRIESSVEESTREWTLREVYSDGTLSDPLWMLQPTEGGSKLDRKFGAEGWWTTRQVFVPGYRQFQLEKGGEVRRRTRILFAPAAFADWTVKDG